MVGLPIDLFTKEDWYNAVEYALSTGNGKDVMIARLNNLAQNTKMNVLREESAGKPAEELTADDFVAIDDPNSEFVRLGFTKVEIENLIGRLQ